MWPREIAFWDHSFILWRFDHTKIETASLNLSKANLTCWWIYSWRKHQLVYHTPAHKIFITSFEWRGFPKRLSKYLFSEPLQTSLDTQRPSGGFCARLQLKGSHFNTCKKLKTFFCKLLKHQKALYIELSIFVNYWVICISFTYKLNALLKFGVFHRISFFRSISNDAT